MRRRPAAAAGPAPVRLHCRGSREGTNLEPADRTTASAATAAPGPGRAPAPPTSPAGGGGPAAPAAPPSTRGTLARSAIIAGILVLVFGVILPQAIDYGEVLAAFQELSPGQLVVITALGAAAWLVSGLVLTALLEGLSPLRGAMSWIILSGIGSSIPFGPWNMGVLWMAVRGWGVTNTAATSGIALYGVAHTLTVLFLPLLAVAALTVEGGFAVSSHPGTAWILALTVAGVAIAAIALIVAIVRSDRIAGWVAHTSQRAADAVVRRLGRSGGPNVERAIGHFRDQLGSVIRRRGLAGLLLATAGHLAWAVVLVGALRMVGLDDDALPVSRIFAVYSLVTVVMLLPIAPGGAGIPEIIFIAALTATADGIDRSTVAAGVFLYRVYFWFLPIPLAWIFLKLSRRGKSTLPSAAELRAMAAGSDAA